MVPMLKHSRKALTTNMKCLAGFVILAACFQPYFVWGDSAAAAAAASSSNNDGAGAAAAAAASSSKGDGAAAAAAAASSGGNSAAAAAAASSTSRAHIPCNCQRIYDPVCGNDGRTYSNACILRCVSANNVQNGRPAIRVQSRGECPRNPCNCNKVLNPLCGSDGNTYGNQCNFDCENARRKAIGILPITVKYPGYCRRPVCVCSDVIIPVCGTDGRTYRNICVLQCTSRINQVQGKPAIYWQYSGACKQEKCICPAKDDFLCGSDGNTYKNDCALACQNRRLDQLGIRPVIVLHKGKCTDCVCSAIYDPVCAGGITFRNICTLDCENRRRVSKGLAPLKYSGKGVCPCFCTLQSDPVCASDQKTYANPCILNCENQRRKDLGLKLLYIDHKGSCICDCSQCRNDYYPVCGSDGRTYWNRCWLDCNRKCSIDLFLWRIGPC